MSPYGITSVGSQNNATPFLMSLTYTSSARSSPGQPVSLIHKLGCLKPRNTRDLLNIATNHTSSKEVVRAIFSRGQDKGKAKHEDQREGPST